MPPKSITLSDGVDEYLHHRKAVGIARGTLSNEERLLRTMLAHVGNIQVRNISERHMDEFFLHRQDKVAASTWNQELAIARLFWSWAERRRYIGAGGSPVVHRRPRKFVPRQRLRIPVTEFARILDAAPHPTDRIIVALGMYLLLRQSEIKGLRIGNVNLETGELAVAIYKTGQRDVMPISLELDAELRRWLTWYADNAPRSLHPSDFLVPAKTRQQFGHEAAYPIHMDRPVRRPHMAVQRALERTGYELRDPETGKSNGEGVHTLRRSAARALFDQLADEGYDGALRTVQAMLHHASTGMTERYLGLEVDKKKRDDLLRRRTMFHIDTSNVTELRAVSNGER